MVFLLQTNRGDDAFASSPLAENLLTLYTKVIVVSSQHPIGIDRDVKVFMQQVIVAASLTDDPEVIHKRVLGTFLDAEFKVGDPCALVFGSSRESVSAHSLWVIGC